MEEELNQQAEAAEETGDEQKETEVVDTQPGDQKKDEDYRAKLNAQNRFLKKEGYEFKDGKWVKPEQAQSSITKEETTDDFKVTPKDYLALNNAKITEDDFDEVVDFAKYRKISVAEALKTQTLKTILAERSEQRQTAKATQIKSPRGTSQGSGDELLTKASKGQLPNDDAGIEALTAARMAKRTQK